MAAGVVQPPTVQVPARLASFQIPWPRNKKWPQAMQALFSSSGGISGNNVTKDGR
jgi:hypothetical protein